MNKWTWRDDLEIRKKEREELIRMNEESNNRDDQAYKEMRDQLVKDIKYLEKVKK